MATLTLERETPVEVWLRRDGWGGVIAEEWSGKEWRLTGAETDWALEILDDEAAFAASVDMEGE